MKLCKRTLAILLALVLLLSIGMLAGCKKDDGGDKTTAPAETASTNVPESETVTETETQTETETETEPEAAGPLKASPEPVTVGKYTLKATQIPFDDMLLITNDSYMGTEFYKDTLYILDGREKLLYEYKIENGTAVLQKKTELEKNFQTISINHEGKPVLSSGVFNAFVLEPDGSLTDTGVKGYVTCSKTQDYAVSTWTSSDTIQIKNGKQSPWVLTGLKDDATRKGDYTMIYSSHIVGDKVFVGGNAKNAEGKGWYTVTAYDFNGKEVFRTKENVPGMSTTCQTETKNGIMDASTSYLSLWNTDGTMIGSQSYIHENLLGIDCSVWTRGLFNRDDGSILLVTVASKPDSTHEVLLFSVEGF